VTPVRMTRMGAVYRERVPSSDPAVSGASATGASRPTSGSRVRGSTGRCALAAGPVCPHLDGDLRRCTTRRSSATSSRHARSRAGWRRSSRDPESWLWTSWLVSRARAVPTRLMPTGDSTRSASSCGVVRLRPRRGPQAPVLSPRDDGYAGVLATRPASSRRERSRRACDGSPRAAR